MNEGQKLSALTLFVVAIWFIAGLLIGGAM